MPVIIDGTLGVNAAAVTTTSWNPTNLVIPGNSTIGDATSDTLTVNATSNFVGKLGVNLTSGTSPTQLLTIKGRFNSDNQNNYYGAWGEGDTAGYSYFAVGEWYNVSAYFQKKIGQSYSHIYTYNSGHNLILQAGSGNNGETAASGNVGIGTTVANTKLEIRSGAPTIRLQETTTGGDKRLEMGVTSAGKAWIGANQSAQTLTFQTVNADRVTIDEAGNVGINRTSPTIPLVVWPTSTSAVQPILHLGYNGSMTSGINGSYLSFGNADPTSNQLARIAAYYEGNTYMGSLRFYTNSNTEGANPSERVRINYNGNVGIGTFSNLNTTLTVAGTITCGTTNSTGGSTLIQNIYSQSSNDYVTLIGEEYSTGAVSINYAVRNSTTDTGFTSSADNVAWARASLKVGGGGSALRLLSSPSALVTKGTTVTLTELMRVTNDGYVNFGSSVQGVANKPLVNVVANSGNLCGYGFSDNTSGLRGRVFWKTDLNYTGVALFNEDNSNLMFGTTGAERMRIMYDGKVGIGTISPTSTLEVNGITRLGGLYTYGSGGYFSLSGSGQYIDVLLSTTWSGDKKLMIEWSFQWNNGDGGTFGIGTIYENYNDTVLIFKKIAEQSGTLLNAATVYRSGTNLYFRATANGGINGYWAIRLMTHNNSTINAF